MAEVTVKKAPKKKEKRASPLEDELARQFDEAKVQYEREYVAIPDRRYRFDFYIRPGILVEVQGGIWLPRGGHNTGAALLKDYEKNNLAVVAGYVVLMLGPNHVKSGQGVEWVVDCLLNRSFP